jgi:hypothetical protein
MPRGKEPCPTKSHPKSPRLARLTRGSLVFFPGDRHYFPAPQSLQRASKQRRGEKKPQHSQTRLGRIRTHTWFLLRKEPCTVRTNGCLLYAASHPPPTAGSCSPPSATLSTLERCPPAASQPDPGSAAATTPSSAFDRVHIPATKPGSKLPRPRPAILRAPEPVQHAGRDKRVHLRR